MTTFSKRGRIVLSVGFGCLLLLMVAAPPFARYAAAAENVNPLAQILAIVMRIENAVMGLSGAGGSLSGLQSDVTAIKTRTDNLPEDTNAVLTELRAKIGLGPMTQMSSYRFLVGTGDTASMSCFSSGPYLAHVHLHGIKAGLWTQLNGSNLYQFGLPNPVSVTFGGNSGDSLTFTIVVQNEFNPNAFGELVVTIQTTEGSITACN